MKKYILEALGVPENILKSAVKLHQDILKQLSYERNETFEEDSEFEASFRTDLMINELNIKTVNIKISLEFVNTDKIIMSGMGYAPRYTHRLKKFVSISLEDFSELYMSISLYVPEDREIPMSDIIKFLKEETKEIIPSLAHELKHSYDQFKQPEKPISHTAEYAGTSNFRAFGIHPLALFFHFVYLSSLTETLVKSTEVASRMELEGINKTQFLEFLLNDKTFKEFMSLKNYTFEGLVSELKEDIETIKSRLSGSDIDVPEDPDDIINLILDLGYVNVVNDKGEILKHLLMSAEKDPVLKFMEYLGGIDPETEKGQYFYKTLSSFSKYKNNPIEFYKKQIKIFNFVGNKMVKKIAKLYEMAQDPEEEYSNVIRKIYIKSNKDEKRP